MFIKHKVFASNGQAKKGPTYPSNSQRSFSITTEEWEEQTFLIECIEHCIEFVLRWYWAFFRFCLNGSVINMWYLYRRVHTNMTSEFYTTDGFEMQRSPLVNNYINIEQISRPIYRMSQQRIRLIIGWSRIQIAASNGRGQVLVETRCSASEPILGLRDEAQARLWVQIYT